MGMMSNPQKKWFWSNRVEDVDCIEMRQHPENGGWYVGKEYVTDRAYDSAIEAINGQIEYFQDKIDELNYKKFRYM